MLCYFTVIQTDLDDFGLRTVRHFQISSWLEYKQVVCTDSYTISITFSR